MKVKTSAALSLVQENDALPYKRVTLGELGPCLPLGMVDPSSGELVRGIATRKWNLRTEKLLGQLREDNPKANPVRFMSLTIALLCEQVGVLRSPDQTKFKKGSKAAEAELQLAANTVGQMWFGDTLYTWLWLRRTCVGPDITLNLTCPQCNKNFKVDGDLDTIDVKVADSLEETFWEYQLETPLTIRGVIVDKFSMGPVRWGALEAMAEGEGLSSGETKASIIQSAIRHVIGLPNAAVTSEELEELSKVDVELLCSEIDRRDVGPDISIETECPSQRCKSAVSTKLDWGYNNFFAASGRRAPQKP